MENTSFNCLQIQPDPENLPHKKMDILFYESATRLQRSYTLMAVYHCLKAMLLIVFIPIDYTQINTPSSPDILAVMVFAMVASLLQMVSVILFRATTLKENLLLLRVCAQFQHSTH